MFAKVAIFAVLTGMLATGTGKSAQAVTDALGTQLNFSNSVALGVGAKVGAEFRYANVLSGVDAVLTYVSTSSSRVVWTAVDKLSSGATRPSQLLDMQFNTADGTTAKPNGSLADPKGNLGHEVKMRLKFYAAGTTTPIELKGFSVLNNDIDVKQAVAFSGATSVETTTTTTLRTTVSASSIKVADINGTDSTPEDKNFWGEWIYDSGVSQIDFSLFSGFSGYNAFVVDFKAASWGTSATKTSYAPPKAVNDSYSTPFNTAVTGAAGSGDAYSAGAILNQTSNPLYGSVSWNPDGTFTYTPTDGFFGTDSFTYEIVLPDGQRASATETITVLPPPRTVTFETNDPSGSTPETMSPQTSSTPTDLTAENFEREGYIFTGWNTAADGSGTAYVDGDSYSFTADLTLYAQWKQIPTVTFEENGGTGTMADQTSLVADELNTATFTRTGYEFVGWNTAADGSGELYADGASYPFTENLTLYARWAAVVVEPTPHTVSFVANGGTGTMPNQTSSTTDDLSAETLTRAGYIFTGWNTAANGSGVTYSDQAAYSFTADMTLYAQWEPAPHTVTYLANDPTSSTTGSMSPQTSSTTENLTLEEFTRSGYTFTGWNTQADGNGTAYLDGASYAFTENLTLYAQWTPVVVAQTSHTVTFVANDPTSSTTGTMSAQTSSAAADLTSENFTRPGYVFTGWNTQADGNGTAYVDGASYDFAADMTLYAQWAPVEYTVTFHANDGAGTMADQTSSTSATLTPEEFTRVGYTFDGWNTQADGNGTDFVDAATYAFTADMTLYAQWTPIPHTVTFMSNGSTGSMSAQTGSTTTDISANTLTRAGYVFAGWNTQPDGSGELYADEAEHAFTEDLILYAQWAAVEVPPTPYTVTYLANDPTNSTSGTMSPQTSAVTANLTPESFTRDGYTFAGWATAASGKGTTFLDGDTYAFRSDMTLYAQWTPQLAGALTPYTVTFIANGASGSMQQQTSASSSILSLNSFSMDGYVFTGWNTSADGSGIPIADGAVYGFTADMTLYAQWQKLTGLASTGASGLTFAAVGVGVLASAGFILMLAGRNATGRRKTSQRRHS